MFKFYFFLVLLSSNLLFAQDFNLTGSLITKNNEIIIGASIKLLNADDSSFVKGTYSKLDYNKSTFSLKAKPSKYILEITHLTFSKKSINISLNKNIDLGEITLIEKDIDLEEIVITADKEYMELNLDKKIFNVSQDKTNSGRSVSDILDNIPSVTVDAEGNVSLRGSEGVRILVDGKQSGLIGRDPESLRMLTGDLVDKIEVITNPSAKYDAEGQVGIINIVLKKEQKKGLNGNTTVNTGMPDNHGLSVSSNYRTKSYNLFSSLGISYNKYPGFADVEQFFYNSDEKYLTTTRRDQERGGTKGTFRFGSDFFLMKIIL